MEEIEKHAESEIDFNTEIAKVVTTYYSENAKVKVMIKAPTLIKKIENKQMRTIFPDGVLVEFYDENESTENRLTAKYAEKIDAEQMIIVKDSVVIKDNEKRLEGEEFFWNEKTNEITSDKMVKVNTPKETLIGYRFWAKEDFSEWTMDSITGVFAAESFSLD